MLWRLGVETASKLGVLGVGGGWEGLVEGGACKLGVGRSVGICQSDIEGKGTPSRWSSERRGRDVEAENGWICLGNAEKASLG